MKILIVGSWVSPIYEQNLYDALSELSAHVEAFSWAKYLGFKTCSNIYDSQGSFFLSIWNRFQNKFITGPAIYKINKALIKKVQQEKPDIIFFYRATHIWQGSVKECKNLGCKILIYNNDDPFNISLPKYIYRHYLKTLQYADWIFSYRAKNIKDYQQLGYKNSSILRSSYNKKINFPMSNEKKYDVVFIGHFENDGRDKILLNIMKKTKANIGLWGQNWENSSLYDELCSLLNKKEIKGVFGDKYNLLLNQSKMALVFFSKINNDGYTRRCFEIPATKTMMLCEYSDEISSLFEADKEAVYFQNPEDLIEKIHYYLSHPDEIALIAQKGYERLLRDGHDTTDRAKEVIQIINQLSIKK